MTRTEAQMMRFDAPGPGSWVRDSDHHTAPQCGLYWSELAPSYAAGFRTCFARYGLPLDCLAIASVHGWAYTQQVPVDPGELSRRADTAARALGERLWLEDAAAWTTERDAWVAAIQQRQAVDLATLDDAALGAEVQACAVLVARSALRHFELVGPGLGIGMLLVAAREWALPAHAVVELLAGASPTTAAPRVTLVALAERVRAAGTLPRTLDELRSVSADAAALLDDHLNRFGWCVLEADLDAPTLAEHPEAIVEQVVALAAADERRPVPVDHRAALREAVPPSGRDRFDQLVAEARTCFSVLDDNSHMLSWATGVLRRAALTAGERLAASGRLSDDSDVFELSAEEIAALLEGDSKPSAPHVAARAASRRVAAATDAPLLLGDPPEPPPSEGLPDALVTMLVAMGAYIELRFPQRAAKKSSRPTTGEVRVGGVVVATGFGVGDGHVRAPCCVVDSAGDALTRMRPGDVLICPFTTPAHNALLVIAGGVVAENGGPLGHTGVTARELGIPAVVGTGPLTIEDGAEVELFVGRALADG